MSTIAHSHPAVRSPRARAVVRATLATSTSRAALIARVALGLILFPHGAQHALGWFGGYGFHGTLGWMTNTLGFPAPAAAVAIVVELLAPIALVIGLGGRLAALGLVGLMLGAMSTHIANGFFMNWFGALPAGSEGFEYHLLVIALAAVVMIDGSGALSVDRLLEGDAHHDSDRRVIESGGRQGKVRDLGAQLGGRDRSDALRVE